MIIFSYLRTTLISGGGAGGEVKLGEGHDGYTWDSPFPPPPKKKTFRVSYRHFFKGRKRSLLRHTFTHITAEEGGDVGTLVVRTLRLATKPSQNPLLSLLSYSSFLPFVQNWSYLVGDGVRSVEWPPRQPQGFLPASH